MISPEPSKDTNGFVASGSWFIVEIESVAVPLPPGAKATPRPGRKELGRQIWEEFLRSEAERKKSATDSDKPEIC